MSEEMLASVSQAASQDLLSPAFSNAFSNTFSPLLQFPATLMSDTDISVHNLIVGILILVFSPQVRPQKAQLGISFCTERFRISSQRDMHLLERPFEDAMLIKISMKTRQRQIKRALHLMGFEPTIS